MSRKRISDDHAPPHRAQLPRQRKRVHFALQIPVYQKLLQLGRGKGESAVATIERLIQSAPDPAK